MRQLSISMCISALTFKYMRMDAPSSPFLTFPSRASRVMTLTFIGGEPETVGAAEPATDGEGLLVRARE